MKNLRNIIIVGASIGAINLAYYNLLDQLPASESTILMLGFVSLIVLPIGIYVGLRKIRAEYAAPLTLIQSLFAGMMITYGAALTVILLRIVTTAVSLSKYETVEAYFASTAPQSTLFWYSVFGLVYCIGVHVIIRYQYINSRNNE